MRYTYIADNNTSTNGTALGVEGQDIFVHRIIVGAPVNNKTITIYDKVNPVNGATTDIAALLTVANTGSENADQPLVFELGLPLGNGGNVIINDDMDVTVVFEELSNE